MLFRSQSSYWPHCAIFIVWDDYGGFYDHVAPPRVDEFGLGSSLESLVAVLGAARSRRSAYRSLPQFAWIFAFLYERGNALHHARTVLAVGHAKPCVVGAQHFDSGLSR